MTKMPDNDFISRLKELAEEKSRNEACMLVARWCYENCPTETLDDRNGREFFRMFAEIFGAMKSADERAVGFPYGSLRREVAHEMELAAIRCFGGAAADALNADGCLER